jgi:ribosomal protein L11 methyltransferase
MTWVLRTTLRTEELNLHLAAMEAAGLLGIEEQEGRANAYFPERAELDVPGGWEAVADQDWNAEARRYLMPVVVGGILVTPPWSDEPSPATVRVIIDPAQAFGTGHHETTTGCLAALQELGLGGRSVLDVGTGSGVLAIAAAKLGAEPVVAVDNDPLATEAAVRNVAANQVDVEVILGSAAAIDGVFDVVIANLDTATITAVARDLAARMAPGGTLIASGVSLPRLDEGVAALKAAGFAVWPRPGGEWVLFRGHKA